MTPPIAVQPAHATSPLRPSAAVREFDSRNLLEGRPCIAIRHGGEIYWLRSTRQGKLLLTK